MLVKFKVDNGSTSGFHNFAQAIKAVMTAAAGSAPSKPSGCIVWDVISYEEAGGWTVEYENTSASSLNSGQELRMNSATKKVNVPNQKKMFGVAVNGTITENYNWWTPIAGFVNRDGNVISRRGMCDYNEGQQSSARYDSWFETYNPDNCSWFISCTENYVWLWKDRYDGNSLVGGNQQIPLCGIADYSGTPGNLLASSNNFHPSAYYYSGSTSTTTFASDRAEGEAYQEHLGLGMHSNGSNIDADYRWGGVSQHFQYSMTNSGSQTVTYNSIELGPQYHQSGRNEQEQFSAVFDSGGNRTLGMYPLVIFNPYVNMPYQTLDGFKYIGAYTDQETNTDNFDNMHDKYHSKYVFDENGDKYICIVSYGIIRAIRAM